MRAAWLSSLPAMLLLGACSFASPDASTDDGGGDGDGGDGDGGDGVGPCADADADTVCDAADKCPDHDDRLDVDGDGVSDGCDDWPCGAVKPSDPGSPMADDDGDDRRWGAGFIEIGDSRRVVAAPGQQFSAQFGWSLRVDCPNDQSSCQAQLEIGYGDSRLRCLFDDDVNDGQVAIGGFDARLTAPTMPGVYELRLNAGLASSCGSGTSWYGGDPGSDSTIAILCVR